MTTAPAAFRHTGPERSFKPRAPGTPEFIGFADVAKAWLIAITISLIVLAPGAWKMYAAHARMAAERQALEARLSAHTRLVAAPPAPILPTAAALHGRDLFQTTCAACHKADGTGMPGLGKDLTTSWFAASLNDDGLREFIAAGRAGTDPLNSTGVPMPPKGGRAELTEADLADLATFVRGLQDPRRMPELPAWVPVAAPTDAEKASALAAAGGDAELAGYIAHGTTLFASTCAACHGKDAKGLPALGKSLANNEFVRKLDDDALLAFVKKGRDPGDPANTTKVGMPPKGGNPALSDDDLLDVIAFLRTLQPPAPKTP